MAEIVTSSLESKVPGFETAFGAAVVGVSEQCGDLSVSVSPERIREMVSFVKQFGKFEVLMDLFAMDYLKYEPLQPQRYAVIYNFYSVSTGGRLRLKAFLPEENPEIDSIHDLYASANWFEREAWDLFGVKFKGHPHLIRILCHDEFEGHPLRKDYPSNGYQRLKTPITSAGM